MHSLVNGRYLSSGIIEQALHSMTLDELKKIYNLVGNRKGWDFSRMKTEQEPAPWDYIEIVIKYLGPSDYVLDIGTGGGEKFIKFSKNFLKGIGIDPSEDMINTAKDNATRDKNTKVAFKLMGAENIQFPENTFDIVLNRHAVVVPKEIVKVLKPGGYFITQQVEKSNMQNLKKAFSYKKTWRNNASSLGKDFKQNGCRIVAAGKYDINYWVKDIESLIFWLKAVDLPENFNIEDHGQQLLQYIEEYSTLKGFLTNEAREFLIIQKAVNL